MVYGPLKEKTDEDPIEDYILERDYSPMRKGILSGLKSPYLWTGIVGAVLIILLVIFNTGGESSIEEDRLFALEDRLSLLEEKISELESLNNSAPGVDESIRKFELLEERMDRLDATIPTMLNQVRKGLTPLKQELAQLKQELAHLKKAPPATRGKTTDTPNTVTAPEKKKAAVYHLVKPGETLYSISKKYETPYQTTVKKLRGLNKLGEGDPIYVGQKLLIHP